MTEQQPQGWEMQWEWDTSPGAPGQHAGRDCAMLPRLLKVEVAAPGRDEPGNPLGIWGRAATALIPPDGGSPFPGAHGPPAAETHRGQVCFHTGLLTPVLLQREPGPGSKRCGFGVFREQRKMRVLCGGQLHPGLQENCILRTWRQASATARLG